MNESNRIEYVDDDGFSSPWTVSKTITIRNLPFGVLLGQLGYRNQSGSLR